MDVERDRDEKAALLQAHARDSARAEELARKSPGSHVTVNGVSAYVPEKRWDEALLGFRLF